MFHRGVGCSLGFSPVFWVPHPASHFHGNTTFQGLLRCIRLSISPQGPHLVSGPRGGKRPGQLPPVAPAPAPLLGDLQLIQEQASRRWLQRSLCLPWLLSPFAQQEAAGKENKTTIKSPLICHPTLGEGGNHPMS